MLVYPEPYLVGAVEKAADLEPHKFKHSAHLASRYIIAPQKRIFNRDVESQCREVVQVALMIQIIVFLFLVAIAAFYFSLIVKMVAELLFALLRGFVWCCDKILSLCRVR